MSIHLWKASTETDAGKAAHGQALYIELFGFVFEIMVARARR